jgi:hypothetical protein
VDHAYTIERLDCGAGVQPTVQDRGARSQPARGGSVTTEATTTLACVGPDARPRLMPDLLWE